MNLNKTDSEYTGAMRMHPDGIIFVFDLTRKETLDKISSFLEEIQQYKNYRFDQNALKLILGWS